MSFRHRIYICLLVVANLIVASYFIASRHNSKIVASPVTINKPQSLPPMKLQDDSDAEFDTQRFIGNPLFVLFINPNIEAQVDAYLRVRTQQLKQAVSWLLISLDARKLRQRLPRDNHDLIVEKGYEELRNVFGVPKCCEEWLIFDSDGKLKDSGKYDDGGVAGRLKSLVDGDVIYSTDVFLATLNSTNDKGLLKQIHAKASHSQSGKAVVALFSSVCTGCPEDYLLDMLRRGSKKNPQVAFLALLPNTFTRSDLDRFKTNLDIPFAVEMANAELSRQWLLLNEKYGWKSTNGTVVVVSGGKIISIVNGLEETEKLLKGLDSKV